MCVPSDLPNSKTELLKIVFEKIPNTGNHDFWTKNEISKNLMKLKLSMVIAKIRHEQESSLGEYKPQSMLNEFQVLKYNLEKFLKFRNKKFISKKYFSKIFSKNFSIFSYLAKIIPSKYF